VFLEVTYFTLITLFAHIVLTLRVYAITGGNKWIAGGLYGLSILQLGVGVYLCVYSFLHPRTCFPLLCVEDVNSVRNQSNYLRYPWMHTGCAFFGFRGSGHSFTLHSLLHLVGSVSTWVAGNFWELNWQLTDLVVFLIILMRTRASRSQRGDSNIPNILNTVTRDAAIYFSVIFTSHFLLVLMLWFVRVRTRNAFWVRPVLTHSQPSLRFLPTV